MLAAQGAGAFERWHGHLCRGLKPSPTKAYFAWLSARLRLRVRQSGIVMDLSISSRLAQTISCIHQRMFRNACVPALRGNRVPELVWSDKFRAQMSQH